MKIILFEDVGKGKIVECRKIEPATISPGKLIIDEEYTVDITNVLMIKDGETASVVPSYSKMGKHFVCPSCSLVIEEIRDNYCPSCGTKIDWDEYYMNEENDEQ